MFLHLYHPFTNTERPDPLSGFDAAAGRRLLERLRPDDLLYTAKGPAGVVPFYTRFGNQVDALSWDTGTDLLGAYREITRELGIRFHLGYSGLIDHAAADLHADWMRVRQDYSSYPSRALCPNQSYVEELLLPQLDELQERYRPDGFYLEHENWTVAPCYCPTCGTEFQMLHSRAAPGDRTDPFWPQWVQFQRDSFHRYLQRVTRFLLDREAELIIASSGAGCSHQADGVPSGLNRLAWELSPAYSLRQAGLEARLLDACGLPFHLLTWNRCSARPWPQGRLPALPAYPKSFVHLAQEGAVILAGGGGWALWMTPYSDDSLPEAESEVAARAAEFARAREPWCRNTVSAAHVGIFHGDAAHRAAGNGLYDPGPSLDRIRGAHQLFQELHHPHDVLTEETLAAALPRLRVLVLPEQGALLPDLDELIAGWVHEGGLLIASGQVAPRIIEDIPTFALEEVLGVRWTGSQDVSGIFQFRGLPMVIGAPVYRVSPSTAEGLLSMLYSEHERDQQASHYPAATLNAWGQGRALYLAAEIFTAYHRCQYPGLRELFGELLDRALIEPPLVTDAPPTVEITLRRQGETTLLHCVNLAPGKSLAQNSAFIENVPRCEPFVVELRLAERPSAVRLQPEDAEPAWSWSEGVARISVPGFRIHSIVTLASAER